MHESAGAVVNQVGGCLVVTVPEDISVETIDLMAGGLLSALDASPATAAILDMSAVSLMDMDDFGALIQLTEKIRLMGTTPVFTGFQAELVAVLGTLGAHSHGVRAFARVEDALESMNP